MCKGKDRYVISYELYDNALYSAGRLSESPHYLRGLIQLTFVAQKGGGPEV